MRNLKNLENIQARIMRKKVKRIFRMALLIGYVVLLGFLISNALNFQTTRTALAAISLVLLFVLLKLMDD